MAEKRHMKFEAETPDDREISFEIEAYDTKGKVRSHTFHCLPDMGAHAIKEFSRLQSEEQWVAAIMEFIEGVIIEEDVLRWQRLAADKRANISAERLVAIFNWLQEQYTDRPTQPSNGSANGRKATDTGSEASSSLRVAD